MNENECISYCFNGDFPGSHLTLQGINESHLGKRKIIFKMPFLRDMLVPWRVVLRGVVPSLNQ